jgi:hypothetical protein
VTTTSGTPPTSVDSWRPIDTVAGVLAAAALFLGLIALIYRPFRLVPAATILALMATLMSRRQQRLVTIAFAVIGICFVVGAALQVVTHHPLY